MRFLPFLVLFLAGCSSASKIAREQELKLAEANSRALEQRRMNAISRGEADSERGSEVLEYNKDKTFNPSSASFAKGNSLGSKTVATTGFGYSDRARTKEFNSGTGAYNSKTAWMGDAKYTTKAASVAKPSWFARMTARTKDYPTRSMADATKAVPVRGLREGERPFLNQGRRQAEFDRKGADVFAAGTYGTNDIGQAWSGDLQEMKPMSIGDVKSLLNKN